MARIDEIEDRLDVLERKRRNCVIDIVNSGSSVVKFASSGYTADIEIDIMSSSIASVDIDINGTKTHYDANYISFTTGVKSMNTMSINIKAEGLLSRKVRIEGIGVKLSTI